MNKDIEVWNAAINAAIKHIEEAPIFSEKDSIPQTAINISIISFCIKHLEKLLK